MLELSSLEPIDKELKVLVNYQKTYFDIGLHVLRYVRTLEFRYKFKSIHPTICSNCGREFRITHFCDMIGEQIWVPNWKAILHPFYKNFTGKPYDQKGKGEQHRKNPCFILDEERERDPNALVIQTINAKPRKNDKDKPRKDLKLHSVGRISLCVFFVVIGFMIILRIYGDGFNFF